jgi:hypothetical protein
MAKITSKMRKAAGKGKAAVTKTEAKAKKGTRKTARKGDRAV